MNNDRINDVKNAYNAAKAGFEKVSLLVEMLPPSYQKQVKESFTELEKCLTKIKEEHGESMAEHALFILYYKTVKNSSADLLNRLQEKEAQQR